VDPGFRLAFGMLHNREAAEDAVQEAVLNVWRKLDRLRPGSRLQPWFLGIVANQCRSVRRARWWSVLKLAAPDVPDPDVEDVIVRGADVRRALRQLPNDRLEALVLHYYLDLPLEEVAAVTGVPLGTVKSRIHRAIAQLRPAIEAEEAFS
jgi:RNA polymerase sigma-70 factor (ECF subfamily)